MYRILTYLFIIIKIDLVLDQKTICIYYESFGIADAQSADCVYQLLNENFSFSKRKKSKKNFNFFKNDYLPNLKVIKRISLKYLLHKNKFKDKANLIFEFSKNLITDRHTSVCLEQNGNKNILIRI